jgi:hypothetical protein
MTSIQIIGSQNHKVAQVAGPADIVALLVEPPEPVRVVNFAEHVVARGLRGSERAKPVSFVDVPVSEGPAESDPDLGTRGVVEHDTKTFPIVDDAEDPEVTNLGKLHADFQRYQALCHVHLSAQRRGIQRRPRDRAERESRSSACNALVGRRCSPQDLMPQVRSIFDSIRSS